MTHSPHSAQTRILDFEEKANHINAQYIYLPENNRLGIVIVHAPVHAHMMDKKMESECAKIIDVTAE